MQHNELEITPAVQDNSILPANVKLLSAYHEANDATLKEWLLDVMTLPIGPITDFITEMFLHNNKLKQSQAGALCQLPKSLFTALFNLIPLLNNCQPAGFRLENWLSDNWILTPSAPTGKVIENGFLTKLSKAKLAGDFDYHFFASILSNEAYELRGTTAHTPFKVMKFVQVMNDHLKTLLQKILVSSNDNLIAIDSYVIKDLLDAARDVMSLYRKELKLLNDYLNSPWFQTEQDLLNKFKSNITNQFNFLVSIKADFSVAGLHNQNNKNNQQKPNTPLSLYDMRDHLDAGIYFKYKFVDEMQLRITINSWSRNHLARDKRFNLSVLMNELKDLLGSMSRDTPLNRLPNLEIREMKGRATLLVTIENTQQAEIIKNILSKDIFIKDTNNYNPRLFVIPDLTKVKESKQEVNEIVQQEQASQFNVTMSLNS